MFARWLPPLQAFYSHSRQKERDRYVTLSHKTLSYLEKDAGASMSVCILLAKTGNIASLSCKGICESEYIYILHIKLGTLVITSNKLEFYYPGRRGEEIVTSDKFLRYAHCRKITKCKEAPLDSFSSIYFFIQPFPHFLLVRSLFENRAFPGLPSDS